MGADLTGILLLVLAAAGLVLLFDRFVLKPRGLVTGVAFFDFVRSVFPILLLVVVFRAFLFEPYRIPSASMMPGLVDGDFILVNKFKYGLRLPLLNTKILPTWEPQRGDVVVFHSTSGPPINLIKRLVGLPGDHIVVRDNHLEINGRAVPLTADGRYVGDYGFHGAELRRERLDHVEHDILLAPGRPSVDFDATVPPGHYFFMGDNRNDSEDSRFTEVGWVPEDHIVGRAVRIWMNWRIPGWPEWGRIGSPIL